MAGFKSTQTPTLKPWVDAYQVHHTRHGVFSWCWNVGTRDELIALGFITADTVLPRKVRGCVERCLGEGFECSEKVSLLGDGRLRIRLGTELAMLRDPGFRRFMAAATSPVAGVEP